MLYMFWTSRDWCDAGVGTAGRLLGLAATSVRSAFQRPGSLMIVRKALTTLDLRYEHIQAVESLFKIKTIFFK